MRTLGPIPLAGPLMLFLLGGLLGLTVSYDWRLSASWLIWLGLGGAIYLLVERLSRDPRWLRRIAAVLVLLATLYALLIMTQYRHLAFEPKFHILTTIGQTLSAPFPKLVARYVDDNAVGGLLGIALPLAVGLALTVHSWRRVLVSGCAALIGFGLLLSAARGAWLATASVGMLGLLGAWERRSIANRPAFAPPSGGARRWRLIALGAGVAGVVALLFLVSRGALLLSAAENRADTRFTLYRNAFLLAVSFPFSGVGPGSTFALIYSRFQLLIVSPYLSYAHNLLLGVWLGQGLLGLAGFCALLLAGFRLARRRMLDQHDPNAALRWGAALGCTVALLHGLTDAPQYDAAWPITLLLFALLGLAVAAPPEQQRLQWIRFGRRGALGFGALAALALLPCGPPLLALAESNIAAVTQARAQLAPELDAAGRAATLRHAAVWAVAAQQTDPQAALVAARRGVIALELDQPPVAIAALEQASHSLPADQAVRKALGYAYIWDNQIAKGVALLRTLERASEVRGELDVWNFVWGQRNRPDLAERALAAARLMDAG